MTKVLGLAATISMAYQVACHADLDNFGPSTAKQQLRGLVRQKRLPLMALHKLCEDFFYDFRQDSTGWL